MSSGRDPKPLTFERIIAGPAGISQFEPLFLILQLKPLTRKYEPINVDFNWSPAAQCQATRGVQQSDDSENRVLCNPSTSAHLFWVKGDDKNEDMKTLILSPGLYCVVETSFTLWDNNLPQLEFLLALTPPGAITSLFHGRYDLENRLDFTGRSITKKFDDQTDRSSLQTVLTSGVDISNDSSWRACIIALLSVYRPFKDQEEQETEHLKVVRNDLRLIKDKLSYLANMEIELLELEETLVRERIWRIGGIEGKEWGGKVNSVEAELKGGGNSVSMDYRIHRLAWKMGFCVIPVVDPSDKAWNNET
ncbi:hypothetical protein GGS21DRAFT_211176 [Xylaria nigripes]|nr:hypothetical protein GGS21DRAFT_211176 [Xylaria nigripes]